MFGKLPANLLCDSRFRELGGHIGPVISFNLRLVKLTFVKSGARFRKMPNMVIDNGNVAEFNK